MMTKKPTQWRRSLTLFLCSCLWTLQDSQGQVSNPVCGPGTLFDQDANECYCTTTTPVPHDPQVINLAGILDTTGFAWAPDVFDVTVQLLNQGEWGVLPPNMTLTYSLENANCDETTAARAYWKLRTANGNQPMDAIVGSRCSGASVTLARLAGLEHVPILSPTSNSARLSDTLEFPYFSRLVAPNNEHGEVGAVIAMLRHFGWSRVNILTTDTTYAKDLANQFRRLFVGDHGDWMGQVSYSDTIRVNADGSINQESVNQALEGIPMDNEPSVASRVIFLAAHSQHAFPILKHVHQVNFQPQSIWVGPSSWVGRDEHEDFSWLPATPGYLGVTIFRNRDDVYTHFLDQLQDYQRARGKEVLTELPPFAAETVDSIRALTWALVNTPNRKDGEAVVRTLRQAEFDGVSGYVQLTESGDRQNPEYSVFNAQDGSTDGTITWTDIGTTGVDIGSTTLFDGFQGVCFPSSCGNTEPPSEFYPPLPDKLDTWVIIVIPALGLLLLLAAFKYWRSRRSKKDILAQLDAFRDSIVGIRAAECNYIPKVPKVDLDLESAKGDTVTVSSVEAVKWMWQETADCMSQHSSDKIHGDPEDCWILYDVNSNNELEEAFQNGNTIVSPLPGYTVDLGKMQQVKVATGFVRNVQRVVESIPTEDDDCEPQHIDFAGVEVGDILPDDLSSEPRMVMVDGDLVQISKQRKDGWAFGTKLHHADENVARNLVKVALNGVDEDDANIFPDTGWFQLDKTRLPTADDLETLRKNVGDAGALSAPSHWATVVDPSVVQLHELHVGDIERKEVENAFLSTLRPPQFNKRVKVVKIERVQNLSMWQSYVVKRQTICYRETGQLADGENDDLQRKALERFERRWLFHGSNREVMDKILQQGLNRSFCGKNATAYGKGVYFARDASYSAHPTYAIPDKKGNQYIMACRVVVGEYCRGKPDALTPDVRDSKTHTLYDTTVGMGSCPMSDPSIYVTYHDAQAYPEYLITFRAT